MDTFQQGFLLGLLVGEGHFGGDGKQPQITLRMHSRHEPMLRRLLDWVPGSKLYGPYHHGGRDYCQWMVRGAALRALLDRIHESPHLLADINPYAADRFARMILTYRIQRSPHP